MYKLGERFLHAMQKGDIDTVHTLTTGSHEEHDYERKELCAIVQYTRSKSGDQAVHIAARHGHVNILAYLGELGVDFEIANLEGKRPLHEAAAGGWTQCVAYLLQQQGVSVDPLKRADWTPLHLACTKPNLSVIQLLIEQGARPELRNKDGWNTFHIASREGHTDILSYLLSCTNVVWNTVSKNGRTPLHTIALHGRLDACKLVLSRCSFDKDVKDTCGSTPLMDALRAGFTDIAQMLIQQHKADVLKEDTLGRTALHLAAEAGHQDAVNFIVTRHNVSVDIATEQHGLTAMHWAAKEGHSDVILTLVGDFQANVNQQDTKGRTALHIAAGSNKVECVRVLVNCGAAQILDNSRNSPKELATNPIILQLLNGIDTSLS